MAASVAAMAVISRAMILTVSRPGRDRLWDLLLEFHLDLVVIILEEFLYYDLFAAGFIDIKDKAIGNTLWIGWNWCSMQVLVGRQGPRTLRQCIAARVNLPVDINLDLDEVVEAEPGAELGLLMMLGVEVKQVQHALANSHARDLVTGGVKTLELVCMFTREPRRKLDESIGHAEIGIFQRHVGLVHVDGHVEGDRVEIACLFVRKRKLQELDHVALGIAATKVKADGLQGQPFQGLGNRGRLVKDLVVRRFGIAGHLHVISSTEDFAGLFEGVFSFTSNKETGNSSILWVKLAIAMLQTQLVEEGTGSVKGFDGEL